MASNVDLNPDKVVQKTPISLDNTENYPSISKGMASLHLDSLSGPSVEEKALTHLNLGNGGIEYSDLNEFVDGKLDELQRFPIDYSFGRDRHSDVTPFPFNQVKIDGNTFGLNGSWISFPDHDPLVTKPYIPGKYIATSAPIPEYFFPFMRMLHQESVPLIISLTDFKEGRTIKADPYLPYEEGEAWVNGAGIYEVKCTKVHSSIDLSDAWKLERRDFELTLRGSSKPHYFSQWHLPHWKDFSPGAADAVANLVKFAYSYRREHSVLAPIVVHCSGGIGRAGTFINCSECYERWVENRPVRIFDIAAQSRLQRYALGGNKDQYQMVYTVFEKLTAS